MILSVTPNPALDRTLFVSLQMEAVNRASKSRMSAGGKGVNVVRAARTLGTDAMCTGFVGGTQGAQFLQMAEREGLPAQWTEIRSETRSCTILVDTARHYNTVINEPGPEVTAEDWQRLQGDVLRSLPQASMLCVCGSAPPGTPVGAYVALIAAIQATGMPVWVDVSGAPLAEAFTVKGVNLKINRDEAGQLIGHPLGTRDATLQAATDLSEQGQCTVIITLGAKGAVYAGPQGRWHTLPPTINRLNAVGSGDSFLAGWLVGLRRGLSHRDAMLWGTAAGTANAAGSGGATFTRAQFEDMLPKIQIEEI